MSRGLKVLLAFAISMAACDSFTCSQQRIRAIEQANQGVTAFQNGLYDTAERELKMAIQTDPTYDLAHYNLGKVFQKQRKWDKAIEAFEAAAQRAPSNANYQYDLGEAYLEAKQMERAEEALKKATELDDKLFKAHWRLGLVYILLERPKDADAALRKAIDSQPAAGQAVRGPGPPVPGLRRRQGGRAGVLRVRAGQRDERRVLQRPRAGAQGPEAVRAGGRRVQEGAGARAGADHGHLQRRHDLRRLVRAEPRPTTTGTGPRSTCRSTSPAPAARTAASAT